MLFSQHTKLAKFISPAVFCIIKQQKRKFFSILQLSEYIAMD